ANDYFRLARGVTGPEGYRQGWLPIQFLLVYALGWLFYWLSRTLSDHEESSTPPRDVRRYSDVSFPPRARVGKRTNLRAHLATSRHHAHDAELALEFPVGAGTLAVTVCVAAENLTVESDPRATLLVPREGDSPVVHFRLVGEQVGPGRVMVDFDQDGRPVGSVDLAVEVGGQADDAAPAPAVEGRLSGGPLPA